MAPNRDCSYDRGKVFGQDNSELEIFCLEFKNIFGRSDKLGEFQIIFMEWVSSNVLNDNEDSRTKQ